MQELALAIRQFALERDWMQFHSPKNLAMALSVEVAEIVEIFQWLSQDESLNLSDKDLDHLGQEIGDVLIYLVSLAVKFDLDPIAEAQRKIVINGTKYPAALVWGKADKYAEYGES